MAGRHALVVGHGSFFNLVTREGCLLSRLDFSKMKSPPTVAVRGLEVARPVPLLAVPQSIPEVGVHGVFAAMSAIRINKIRHELWTNEMQAQVEVCT